MSNDLKKRVEQHKSLKKPGFTSRYRITKLVYYEHFGQVERAIKREKQIKAGSRAKKDVLVDSMNPEWRDLYPIILGKKEGNE
jgi:putative endonuclease